jgi:hypothetical protein
MLTMGTHVTNGGVHGLVERPQLYLQFWQKHTGVREQMNREGENSDRQKDLPATQPLVSANCARTVSTSTSVAQSAA